jgi:acyl dehydratase
MTLNRDFIGRTYGPTDIYEVSREKIREYALSTGDEHPAYFDAQAAKRLGYPDVIAPPSFFNVLFFRMGSWPLHEPSFGKQRAPVCVHRAQRVVHHRPMLPGDRLVQTTTVREIFDLGPHEQFVLSHEIKTVEGGPVCSVVNTLISRGTAAPGT